MDKTHHTPSLFILIGALFSLSLSVCAKTSDELKDYYHSGRYFSDIEKSLSDAKNYLDTQLYHKGKRHIAIVFDIDETILSNYADLERLDFTQNRETFTALTLLSKAKPILPIRQFYLYANSRGVPIFFISERPNTQEMIEATTKNLKAAGYLTWQQLILQPLDETLSQQAFKTQARRHITQQGYDIVLNFGDQDADLFGGFAEARVKLPNPFYDEELKSIT